MFSLDQLENLLEQEEQEKGGNQPQKSTGEESTVKEGDRRKERDESREGERRKHSSKSKHREEKGQNDRHSSHHRSSSSHKKGERYSHRSERQRRIDREREKERLEMERLAREQARRSSRSLEREAQEEELKRQQEFMVRQQEQQRRMMEEAKRDDCTVMILRLNINANERDVYQFLSKAGVGKVRDVRIIRDPRSKKSKGVAYVEFYTPESVLMSLSLTGQKINGQDIIVQASQGEKNRAAAQAKARRDMYRETERREHLYKRAKAVREAVQGGDDDDPPSRIYISGLEGLGDINDNDLRKLFAPFGTITYVDIYRDPATQKSKGFGFIHYARSSEARQAIKGMNNFEYEGKMLKVGRAPAMSDPTREKKGPKFGPGGSAANDLDDDNPNQFLQSAQSRQIFMQKLAGQLENQPQYLSTASGAGSVPSAPPLVPQSGHVHKSHCLLLANMFDPADPAILESPNFFLDLKEDVMDACTEFGRVERVFVEEESTQGNVWVEFVKTGDNTPANMCLAAMNGRYYAKRIISANYVPENVMRAKIETAKQ